MFGWKSGDSRKRRKNSYTSCENNMRICQKRNHSHTFSLSDSYYM